MRAVTHVYNVVDPVESKKGLRKLARRQQTDSKDFLEC